MIAAKVQSGSRSKNSVFAKAEFTHHVE